MKYGLMYYKATDNIGDDIQTYAAIKYLPHIDYYIDREDLSCFVPDKKEYVSMIMNGWFIHNKLAWPPSPYIKPLPISMHFKSLDENDVGDMYLKGYGGEFLKKYGPAGARDIETLKRLLKNGIEAYFSGCLTLTLEKFPRVRKKKKICLVDVGQEVIEKVKNSCEYEIEVLTHSLNQNETAKKWVFERMREVELLLKKYQEARFVITTRLHAALPCVALGTPVIVLHKKVFDMDRLETFFNLFSNYEEEEFLEMNIGEFLKNSKANSSEYVKIKKDLEKRCKEFIKRCEINEENEQYSELPEIKEYTEYIKKLEWYKAIYEKERLIVEKIEKRRVQEYELYHKNLEKINSKEKNSE